MADLTDTSQRASLLPPDPRAGRRQFGPMLLLIVGLGSIGIVYAYRERLRPAPIALATIEASPTFFDATSIFSPLAAKPPATAPTPANFLAVPTIYKPVDVFAEPLLPTRPATPAKPEFDAAKYKVQSIVIGRRGSSCLINGRPYQVGDKVDGATVRAIDRQHVVLEAGRTEFELRLPAAAGIVRVSAAR